MLWSKAAPKCGRWSRTANNKREEPMIDSNRRTVIATGAAAAAASAVPQVFAQGQAQAQGAAPATGLPDGAKVGFYEKDGVRIRYAEIGSGFPLLATPG